MISPLKKDPNFKKNFKSEIARGLNNHEDGLE